jgi:hypothetical protein
MRLLATNIEPVPLTGSRDIEVSVSGIEASPGEELRSSVLSTFSLEAHELIILDQACATADTIADLEHERDRAVLSPTGQKPHPLLVEIRMQRLTLGRLVSSLRLPGDENHERTARRGARGFYSVNGGA